jgi:hypothetical protein
MTVDEFTRLLSAIGGITSPIAIILIGRLSKKTDNTNENVKKIEIATNSMKDALVKATAAASHAAGLAEGLTQGRDEQNSIS